MRNRDTCFERGTKTPPFFTVMEVGTLGGEPTCWSMYASHAVTDAIAGPADMPCKSTSPSVDRGGYTPAAVACGSGSGRRDT